MVKIFDLLVPFINILIGGFMILIGFKIYKPFVKEKAEDIYRKYGTFYQVGGIAMFTWGVIKALIDFKVI
jgi:hypothetical protein